MAISTNTVDFQRVQVAAPGTSVAASPQPYDNTHTVVFFNRGANTVRIGLGTPGGAIVIGGGAELPANASLTWSIGTIVNRAGGEFLSSQRIIIDSVGGAGDVVIQYFNSTLAVSP